MVRLYCSVCVLIYIFYPFEKICLTVCIVLLLLLFIHFCKVAQKSTKVTADVVRYKYGDTAGTLVQETGDSLGNVVRTLTHIAAVEGKVMAEAIAKNTGKVAIKGDRENTNSCERPNADERTGSEKHSMSSPQAGVIDNKAKHLKEIDGKACSSCSHD
mmetsp:Transcript_42848/g.64553  ORF Transcript_42848/g.64553 Transcript_42848/m.64553 type:complete len:158 (-) Transcript_42848:26-499(-)